MNRLYMTAGNYAAAIEGRKTQTRRVMNPQPPERASYAHILPDGDIRLRMPSGEYCVWMNYGRSVKPRYRVGEVVALTLPHWRHPDEIPNGGRPTLWDSVTNMCRFRWPDGEIDSYEAQKPIPNDDEDWRLMPAMYMPVWAALHWAEIVSVRAERLHEIAETDAIAEGVQWPDYEDDEDGHLPHASGKLVASMLLSRSPFSFRSGPARIAFKRLWDSINGKRDPWDSNPWVWVYDFKRAEVPDEHGGQRCLTR